MRKQTRHRFVATNYNHYKCLLPFLLYNSYCTKFAQQCKGKLAKTKIFLSLTSGVCFFALIFENYHTIPLAQNEIHLQLQLKSPIQDDGALVLYIKATINLVHKGYLSQNVFCYFTWQPFCPGCIYIIWCLLFIAVQLPTRIWPFSELHVPTS